MQSDPYEVMQLIARMVLDEIRTSAANIAANLASDPLLAAITGREALQALAYALAPELQRDTGISSH